jgi:hypothetical protein
MPPAPEEMGRRRRLVVADPVDPAEAVDRAAGAVARHRAWQDPGPINRAARPFVMS